MSGRGGVLHLAVDARHVSIAAAIRAAATAASAPAVILTMRSVNDLAVELGGVEQAGRFLVEVANQAGVPIGLTRPRTDGRSETTFISPAGWSAERLAGWVAARHTELEAELGQVERVELVPRRKHGASPRRRVDTPVYPL